MGQVLAVNLRSPVAIASILHRISGVIVFLLVPVLLWLLDKSLSSPEGFAQVQEIFSGFFVRFIVWVFVAGLIYHFFTVLSTCLLISVWVKACKVVVLQLQFHWLCL